MNPPIFISYAKEDKEFAERLFSNLQGRGLNPWLDIKCLLPGQQWKFEIEKAIEKSRFFIAILSIRSIDKVGHVQKELKKALDILDNYPNKDVFLIPIRLDDCQPSTGKLLEIHWVDMFPKWDDGLSKILEVIKTYSNSEVTELNDNRSLDEKLNFLNSSTLGQTLLRILQIFPMDGLLTRRQVSLQLETDGTLTRAYLEMLRHHGMILKFPQTNGHTERLGKIENLNLEVSNERRKWTEEVRQAV